MTEAHRTEEERLGDEPAHPLNFLPYGMWERSGLTKRERLALAAMQGCLAANCFNSPEQNADYSVRCADALLKELAK